MTTGSSVSYSENDTSRQRRHCSERRRISHRFTINSGNIGT
jgi:hypothetical protein